ncbi:ATP-binding cassette domain-containing protein, partial [Stutzerimonas stutzeri]|uniref:ATP-binding cassette domain-containing protein n=1 Tax=Stutzerimonas stutzeri TaxID=316 RepID=UPI00331645F6
MSAVIQDHQSQAPLVSLRNLNKHYGDFVAVDNISLDIQEGEFLTFLGSSGSGKSTTLSMLAGFETPSSGEILVTGQSLVNVPPHKRDIGMVFQRYSLFPHLNVRDNIGFPLEIRKGNADLTPSPYNAPVIPIGATIQMKQQASFADLEYSARRKPTRREKFLTDLDRLVPWSQLVALIEPHYYRGERGRPPVGLETMLRMYLCQNCLGLSDEGIEDAIVDSIAVRRFVGIDLIERQAPDATTLLKFRRCWSGCRT